MSFTNLTLLAETFAVCHEADRRLTNNNGGNNESSFSFTFDDESTPSNNGRKKISTASRNMKSSSSLSLSKSKLLPPTQRQSPTTTTAINEIYNYNSLPPPPEWGSPSSNNVNVVQYHNDEVMDLDDCNDSDTDSDDDHKVPTVDPYSNSKVEQIYNPASHSFTNLGVHTTKFIQESNQISILSPDLSIQVPTPKSTTPSSPFSSSRSVLRRSSRSCVSLSNIEEDTPADDNVRNPETGDDVLVRPSLGSITKSLHFFPSKPSPSRTRSPRSLDDVSVPLIQQSLMNSTDTIVSQNPDLLIPDFEPRYNNLYDLDNYDDDEKDEKECYQWRGITPSTMNQSSSSQSKELPEDGPDVSNGQNSSSFYTFGGIPLIPATHFTAYSTTNDVADDSEAHETETSRNVPESSSRSPSKVKSVGTTPPRNKDNFGFLIQKDSKAASPKKKKKQSTLSLLSLIHCADSPQRDATSDDTTSITSALTATEGELHASSSYDVVKQVSKSAPNTPSTRMKVSRTARKATESFAKVITSSFSSSFSSTASSSSSSMPSIHRMMIGGSPVSKSSGLTRKGTNPSNTKSSTRKVSQNLIALTPVPTIATRDFSSPIRTKQGELKIVGISPPRKTEVVNIENEDPDQRRRSCLAAFRSSLSSSSTNSRENNRVQYKLGSGKKAMSKDDLLRAESIISPQNTSYHDRRKTMNHNSNATEPSRFSFQDIKQKSSEIISKSAHSVIRRNKRSTSPIDDRILAILLLEPKQKIFEVVFLPNLNLKQATVGDAIYQARSNAIDSTLSAQKYQSLCNSRQELAAMMLPVEFLIPPLKQPDPTKNKKLNSAVLLVAVPVGYTAKEMQTIKAMLWKNPKTVRWWEQQDPLSPVKPPKAGRGKSAEQSNTSIVAASSLKKELKYSQTTPGIDSGCNLQPTEAYGCEDNSNVSLIGGNDFMDEEWCRISI